MKAKWLVLSSIVLFISTGASWAQSSPGPQGSQSSSSKQRSQPTPRHIQASKLIGSEIRNSQGETIGRVEDLVINPQNGKVRMAILGTSLAGGQGEMFTPIPWTALNVSSERNYVVNIDRQKLSTAPSMSKGQYSDLEKPDYVVRIYKFYDLQNPEDAVGGTGQDQSGQQQGSGSSSQEKNPQQQEQQQQ
jgi:sporulation protein YlmC with PRC-barrel domain